jgi:hypothetical protein
MIKTQHEIAKFYYNYAIMFITHPLSTYLKIYVRNHIQNRIPFSTGESAKNNLIMTMTPNAN